MRIVLLALALPALALPALALPAPALPAAARGGDTLAVVTLNLWHDQDHWPRRRALILDGLRALRPDVVCLQEVLQHASLRNQALDLADSLGYAWTFGSVDPDTAVKRYGNAILVRHPVLASGWKALEPLDDYRTVVHMRIAVGGRPVDVFNAHLHHTAEGAGIRARQVRDLLAYVDSVGGRHGPVALVLAGDFNAPPAAPELDGLAARFVDVYGTLRPDRDTVSTLNPAKGHTPRRIDHLFVPRGTGARGGGGAPGPGRVPPPRLTPLSAEVMFDAPAADGTWASDHFGVVGRFLLGP